MNPKDEADYADYSRWAIGRRMTREAWMARRARIRATPRLSTNPYEWGVDMAAIQARLHPGGPSVQDTNA